METPLVLVCFLIAGVALNLILLSAALVNRRDAAENSIEKPDPAKSSPWNPDDPGYSIKPDKTWSYQNYSHPHYWAMRNYMFDQKLKYLFRKPRTDWRRGWGVLALAALFFFIFFVIPHGPLFWFLVFGHLVSMW